MELVARGGNSHHFPMEESPVLTESAVLRVTCEVAFGDTT